MDDAQSLRRSARIFVRGFTKNYSPKKTRKKRAKGKGKAQEPGITEADLRMALQAEAVQSNPLDEGKIGQIDKYCGINERDNFMPHDEGPSRAAPINLVNNEEDYGESIIGDLEFNSEDDKFTDDEYASEEGGH